MSKQGRPPNHQPKTAYDVHRYLTLVQILAQPGSDELIRDLCKKWEIEPVEDRSVSAYYGIYPLDAWATIRKLAQHVIEYHRSEER